MNRISSKFGSNEYYKKAKMLNENVRNENSKTENVAYDQDATRKGIRLFHTVLFRRTVCWASNEGLNLQWKRVDLLADPSLLTAAVVSALLNSTATS